MKYSSLLLCGVASLLMNLTARGGVTFQLNYEADDIANQTYWYDPTYGAQARKLLQKMLNEIGEELDSEAVMVCNIESYGPSENVGFLAGAASNLEGQVGNQLQNGALEKIVNGNDLNGFASDARIAWNFARGFTGSNGLLAYIPYTFNHELSHILYAYGGANPIYSQFNSFFYDSKNQPWIANGKWTAAGLAAEDNDAESYFRAFDGTHYQIYKPGDVSHLKDTFFNHPFNNDDRKILRTLGYKLVPRLNVTAGNGQTFLSWNPALLATSYTIKRAATSGGPSQTIGTTTSATTFNDTGLTNGTTYYYAVFATETGGIQAGSSMWKSATSGASSPGNSSFEIPALGLGNSVYNPAGSSWNFTPSSGSNGSGVTTTTSSFTSANVTVPDGFQSAFLQGTGSISQTASNLIPGRTYRLSFSASQRGSEQIGQTFNVKLDNTVVGSYAPVQRDAGGKTIPIYTDYTVNLVPTAASQTLAFVGTNLNGGDNTVLLDNVHLSALPEPTQLVATLSGKLATLNWQPVEGATSYNVKRSFTEGAPYKTIASGATSTSFSETISGQTFYVVSAVSGLGESGDSNQATAEPVINLDAPKITSDLSGDYVVIDWLQISNATSYNIKRATQSGGPYTTVASRVTTTEFYQIFPTPSYYVVSAVNGSNESRNSNEIVGAPPPVTPEELVAPPFTFKNGQSSISLTTSVAGRTYQLQRNYDLKAGSWVNIGTAKAGGKTLSFLDTPDPMQPRAFYRLQLGP